ncbi:MAG: hypothetical protein AAF721_21780 [Myxococcota bacterium]
MAEGLLPLGRLALGVAIDSLRVGRDFVVFAIRAPADGEPTLHWYVDADEETSVTRARHETATSDCQRYAIARQQEVRDREGTKRLAAVVEVGDRDHEQALTMAQHYQPFAGPGTELSTLGNPMMLGDTTNVLRGSTLDPGRAAAFIVVCPKCKKRNRVALARVRDRLPKCGACSESLLDR